jgi:uracil-DNA glycosylase family protein
VKPRNGVRAEPAQPERPGAHAGGAGSSWMALDALRRDASVCTSCDLYRDATQTVFGEGNARAAIMLVGEQPGDREDVEGAPFVGPAGGVLERALAEAGIERHDTYVTNAVKHFKFVREGKRRIHAKPNRREVLACKQWLDAEIAAVRPKLVVALGATAAQALMGPKFRVTQQRGEIIEGPGGIPFLATVHPSSILRAQGGDARHDAMQGLVADLRVAAKELANGFGAAPRGAQAHTGS